MNSQEKWMVSNEGLMRFKGAFFNRANQVFIDIIVFSLSFFTAILIRFEGFTPVYTIPKLSLICPFIVILRLLCFIILNIYSISWRYISLFDALKVVSAISLPTILFLLQRILIQGNISLIKLPYGVIAIEFMLVVLGSLGVRLARRMLYEISRREKYSNFSSTSRIVRIILIGAGDAGHMISKELVKRGDLGYDVIGFIDDDPRKLNIYINGIKVLGGTDRIPKIVSQFGVELGIITIANTSSKEIKRIVETCHKSGLKVKIIPGMYEMLDERIKISKIRDIDINDLLGRTMVDFKNNLPHVTDQYRGKRILITGAGGSIGSELCRQLAAMSPKEMILLDKDENSIFEIHNELLGRPQTDIKLRLLPIIANINSGKRLAAIFEKYQPDVVFHAAAHKHVPLMEFNISEAVLNNIMGTKNIIELADQYHVEKLIFISTDKAVNPTSIMGATKKFGEIIVQDIAQRSKTKYACIRFGNVLGSRGSVVPTFQKQIALGGPVTITHPEVRRYFMSISEAVQLIIRAGTIGNNGEIFVLDMGEPIKISDLARDLIKLSGFSEEDIEIQYIGLRPGEKLYEEILIDEEKDKATNYEKIFIAQPVEINGSLFFPKLKEIIDAALKGDEHGVVQGLKESGIGYSGNPHLE